MRRSKSKLRWLERLGVVSVSICIVTFVAIGPIAAGSDQPKPKLRFSCLSKCVSIPDLSPKIESQIAVFDGEPLFMGERILRRRVNEMFTRRVSDSAIAERPL